MRRARGETVDRPVIWVLRVLITLLLLAVLFASFAAATVTARHANPANSPAGPTPTPRAAISRQLSPIVDHLPDGRAGSGLDRAGAVAYL